MASTSRNNGWKVWLRKPLIRAQSGNGNFQGLEQHHASAIRIQSDHTRNQTAFAGSATNISKDQRYHSVILLPRCYRAVGNDLVAVGRGMGGKQSFPWETCIPLP